MAGRPWWVDYGDNPGLVFPVGVEDFLEEHAQRVHVIDAEMDNVMVVATAQRGKSTTLMTLITAGALMYRPGGDVLLRGRLAVPRRGLPTCGRCREYD